MTKNLEEVSRAVSLTLRAAEIIRDGGVSAAEHIRERLDRTGLDGYWVHLDVDILDPAIMPAVDSPDPGGLDADHLVDLLAGLAPRAVGAQVTVFDPDLDPDGRYAHLLTDVLTQGLGELGRAR